MDAQNGALTYLWDFGDGSAKSTDAKPSHTFTASGIKQFTVKLTVTNAAKLSATTTQVITVNDAPPKVSISQPEKNCIYPVSLQDYRYSIKYAASDANHASNTLSATMEVFLHHDTHQHLESTVTVDPTQTSSSIVIAPLGCETATYWYCVKLTVTNPSGLSSSDETCMYPEKCNHTGNQCSGGVPEGSCNVFTDLDILGNDLVDGAGNQIFKTDVQAGECCSECQKISGCLAWTWFQNVCYFKGVTAINQPPTSKVGAISGKRKNVPTIAPTPAPPSQCGTLEQDVDYPGNDIGNKPSANAAGCCDLCAKFAGCTTFTWSNYNGGTCWLKSKKGTAAKNVGNISGALTTVPTGPTCYPLEKDVDYSGADVGNVQNPDASSCCAACGANAECNAYSWSNWNGGTCWLKAGKGTGVAKVGVQSARVYKCAALEVGTDYVDNDIGPAAGKAPEDCCGICRKTAGCGAFSWSAYNGGTCWLKSKKGATVAKADTTSATIA